MKKIVLFASSALVSMFAAQSALAGEWTGFYIGANVGAATGDVDWTNVSNATGGEIDFTPGQTIGQSPDGVLGGVQLGYNFQMTSWVFGLEATGFGLDFDETTANPNPGGADEFVSSEMDWLATAAARVGFASMDSLFYLKGGYATANVTTEHVDPAGGPADANDPQLYSTDETHHGWMAGAGIEHQIGSNVSVGLEYNYIDLGETDHSGVTTGGTDLVVNNIDVQLHTVTARLNYHFNPF